MVVGVVGVFAAGNGDLVVEAAAAGAAAGRAESA